MTPAERTMTGKVAASMTHEMNNVLATIKETVGLMQDILAVADMAEDHRDKLTRASQTAARQVERGVLISRRFNAFAHSMDRETGELDLNEAAALAVFLMQRPAGQMRIELIAEPADQPVRVTTEQTRLVLLLCAGLEKAIKTAPSGSRIVLKTGIADREAAAALTIQVPSGQTAPGPVAWFDDPGMAEILARLGARIRPITSHDAPGQELVLPA